MKVGLCDLHPVCESPPINFWMPEWIFMKLGMYIMKPEPISTAYSINPSYQCVCVSVCVSLLSLLGKGLVKCIPPFIARQRLTKHVPMATNTCNNRSIVGCVSLWVCLCIPLSLLCNNSEKMFPRQKRNVEGIVFYAVHVVSEESRQLVLPRTSCFIRHICHLSPLPHTLWANSL
jgi:hypothetical protein